MPIGTITRTNYKLPDVGIDPKLYQKNLEETFKLELAIAEIEAGINAYTTRDIMDETQVTEIETTIDLILSTHPARKDYQSSEDFDNMMGELAGDVADASQRPTAENHPF